MNTISPIAVTTSISSLRGNKGRVTTESASHTSLSSLRENISRAIRGTPPPPYEVSSSEDKNIEK